MLGKKKNIFWQAFLLAGIVFILGLLLGVAFEASRADKFEKFYTGSEISLMDYFALSQLTNSGDVTCETLINSNINFADQIYEEARLLNKYEESNSLTQSLKLLHRKYDVLRTFLWINSMKTLEKCEEDVSVVVYLYEFETEDLDKKATHNVWGKILFDLKQEKAGEIILIPIAVDSDLVSLNSMINQFDINKYPVVIINNKKVLDELTSVEDIEEYL